MSSETKISQSGEPARAAHRDAHAVAEIYCHHQLLGEGSAERRDQDVRHASQCCPSREAVICVQGMPPGG